MKNHNTAQATLAHKYFDKVLGYGNKCINCNEKGKITVISINSVGFRCLHCKINWSFETKERIPDLLLKTIGI